MHERATNSFEPARRGRGAVACGVVCAWLWACAAPPAPPPPRRPTATVPSPAPTPLDFSFADRAPIAGTRLTACGRVALSTTRTERAGAASFRNDPSGQPATVAFTFDRAVGMFEVAVSRVGADDRLAEFNVDSPDKLSGALIQTADGQVTGVGAAQPAGGSGRLIWTTLNALAIRFTIRSPPGGAVSVDGFAVACRP